MTPIVTKKTKQMIHYALGQSLLQQHEWQRERTRKRKTPSSEIEQEMREISALMDEVNMWETVDII